jgi:hypothetical protein
MKPAGPSQRAVLRQEALRRAAKSRLAERAAARTVALPAPQQQVLFAAPAPLTGDGANFPDAPVFGQTFGVYVWDGEKWVVSATGTGGVSEAPLDHLAYGRRDAAWTQVIMSSGDVVDGGNY